MASSRPAGMASRANLLLLLSHAAVILAVHPAFSLPATGQRRLTQAATLGCMQDSSSGKAVPWSEARRVETYASALRTNNNYNLARQSVYEGPIGHIGFCGKPLFGNPDIGACAVAIGKKWLDHATPPGPGNCNRCMCVRILSADNNCNRYAPPQMVAPVKRKTFRCQVLDQCPECKDNHIDILLDGVYADADNVSGTNSRAKEANARWAGKKGYPIISGQSSKTVGIWITEWIWASSNGDGCSADCDAVFAANDGAQQQAANRRPGTKAPSPKPKAAGGPKPKAPAKAKSGTKAPVKGKSSTKKPARTPVHKTPNPTKNAPAPANTPVKTAQKVKARSCMLKSKWEQCGGTKVPKWAAAKGEKGGNRPWKTICCKNGSKCVRNNKALWRCQ